MVHPRKYSVIFSRPRPKFEIWVCETPPIIVYSDVAIFPRFGGKRDVAHLIYVKIKPYHFLCCFGKDGVVSNFLPLYVYNMHQDTKSARLIRSVPL